MILGVLLVWLTCDNGVVLLVAGHRTFALCLITSILENAVVGLQGQRTLNDVDQSQRTLNDVDWQAVWAYALGPEPGLTLTLR
jgi:hypothetical protein